MVARHLQKDRIAILKCGVDRWNAFRREFPDYLVMHCISMPEAQLQNADLHRVGLMESNLRRANLCCASFERAVLRKTDFSGSDLRSAILDGADLCRADFSGADLRDASLVFTFLKFTDLRGADLSTARGLTDAQIRDSYGDANTRLPADLARPESWT